MRENGGNLFVCEDFSVWATNNRSGAGGGGGSQDESGTVTITEDGRRSKHSGTRDETWIGLGFNAGEEEGPVNRRRHVGRTAAIGAARDWRNL
ncbi:hypothetical protein HPP92_016638 [Vanilla planifolia]|uniref:Uncharacterized protein n=1 Tax=Vanilla planifolia TaxID=51239 RepID=A0A835QQN6_VANPL|nr:hypothetical protein HPP92_016638 [Vanilla planifolia]